jgi:hypothetical protein
MDGVWVGEYSQILGVGAHDHCEAYHGPDEQRQHEWRLSSTRKEIVMPKYVIERDIPGAGKMSSQDLKAIAQKSCGVLEKMGPQIQWVQSYMTDDKVYCVYVAPNEKMVQEHAQQGGFPANRISRVTSVIDPTTAE